MVAALTCANLTSRPAQKVGPRRRIRGAEGTEARPENYRASIRWIG